MLHDRAPTILAVDEDASLGYLLHEVLVDERYRVLLADDGVRSFDLAVADRPAVILLEMGVRLATRVDFLGRLQQDWSTTQIPVVALTGQTLPVGNGPVGLDGWIEKPSDVDVLLEQVGRLAVRRRSTVAAFTTADATG